MSKKVTCGFSCRNATTCVGYMCTGVCVHRYVVSDVCRLNYNILRTKNIGGASEKDKVTKLNQKIIDNANQ